MDRLDVFCSGECDKKLKFYFFKEFMKGSKIDSLSMLEDKKSLNKKQWGRWSIRISTYCLMGIGYGYVFNSFRASRIAYLVFPCLCCGIFGYYDYMKDNYELYKIADRYEVQAYKYFCKKH